MRDGDGVHLELVPAVGGVGLADGVFEDLLVALLAQDRPDVHHLGLAAAAGAAAHHEHGQEEEETHLDGKEEDSN